MSERQIINRMKKLQELEIQEKQLKAEIATVKKEIQDQMQDKETINAGAFLIRWTRTISDRFDSKSFAASHKQLYNRFVKPVESRRFSYTVAE